MFKYTCVFLQLISPSDGTEVGLSSIQYGMDYDKLTQPLNAGQSVEITDVSIEFDIDSAICSKINAG